VTTRGHCRPTADAATVIACVAAVLTPLSWAGVRVGAAFLDEREQHVAESVQREITA
jgi:hypothetical protein